MAEQSVTLFSLAANRITKLRISAVTVALRRAGSAYDPRRRRITCTGRQDQSLPHTLMPTSASTAGSDHPGILFRESRCHADDGTFGGGSAFGVSLDQWILQLQRLTPGTARRLRFDFSDQCTAWLRVECIDGDRALVQEGWSSGWKVPDAG